MKHLFLAATVLAVASCGSEQATSASEEDFETRLRAYCGQAFEGRLVSNDEADADFASETLVMHVRECKNDEVRVPLHVGEDRSRTWVITRTEDGLRLKHDHRHEDGEEDVITQYGGDSEGPVSGTRVEFPVDQYSIDLFTREGLTASVTNTWALELTDAFFAYELSRENRFFRAEFDLSAPITPPPPPWGAEE